MKCRSLVDTRGRQISKMRITILTNRFEAFSKFG